MRELRNILAAFDQLVAAGEGAVLASVVAVNGSTYRRPGARTLILPDETTIGLVSGGCLEGDLTLRAREVRAEGRPRLAHYDSTQESDIVWGLGLGCAGMVEVLLERVDARDPGPLEWLRECLGARQAGVIATPLQTGGVSRVSRLALRPNGEFSGSAASDAITQWVETEARRSLEAGRTAIRRVARPSGGSDEAQRYLFEYVAPALRLLIFGAGVDAVPLSQFAASLGWEVIVVNNRGARATADYFSSELRVANLDPKQAKSWCDELGLDDRTAAVVMTHHYLDDREILRALLKSPLRYVGLLGPRQRGDDLLGDLRTEGSLPGAMRPESLFSPAGLDVGADAPEQIALAVVAEIQAVFSHRSGNWLRDRKDAIHDPIAT